MFIFITKVPGFWFTMKEFAPLHVGHQGPGPMIPIQPPAGLVARYAEGHSTRRRRTMKERLIGDDQLLGSSGRDILLGQDGDDYLNGASSQDTVSGGAGTNRIITDASDVLDETFAFTADWIDSI